MDDDEGDKREFLLKFLDHINVVIKLANNFESKVYPLGLDFS